MDKAVCPTCRVLRQRIAELEAQLEAALRAGKRQAGPFSKGQPKKRPKKPGRKPGPDYGTKAQRPPPEHIDETLEAPLPDVCPDCGGPVVQTEVRQQFQVEIPRQPIQRRFDVHIGCCRRCHGRVQGRHPLQTSDALGAAASQLGADVQAALVDLNKNAGLSHGKISQVLRNLFGIRLSKSGVAHVILRAGRRCHKVYQGLCQALPRSAWVVPDETGWRVGGQPAWLHGLVTPQATAYVIDPTRSGQVAEQLLGRDYAGVMIHDGWSPYDNFLHARHQQCLAHLLRRCREMLHMAGRGAGRFPRQIHDRLQAALSLRDRHAAGQISDHGLAVARGRLQQSLHGLIANYKQDAGNERLAAHLWKHQDQLWTFLKHPGLDATNWRAELAMRFGVILRKVWGGNRTWAGAFAQAALMSVWRTCWQQGRNAVDFLSQLLRGQPALLAMPP